MKNKNRNFELLNTIQLMPVTQTDRYYLRRCLHLALSGKGQTSPNPLVGSIIANDEKIFGEGFHLKAGTAHAEVNALNNAGNSLPEDATLYVNLEPCAHFGRTPPCSDAIIESRIKRVVIGNTDPDTQVQGKGVQKMRDAGIHVETGIEKLPAFYLNLPYFVSRVCKRPFVLLKWAESADRYIADEHFQSKWLSNAWSRQLVHKWRFENDAVMVGTNTARYDDPQLTIREWTHKNNSRVTIDAHGTLSENLKIFNGSYPTILFSNVSKYEKHNVKTIELPESNKNRENIMLQKLFEEGIYSVMIEGGSALLNSFINAGLWDEARIFQTSKILKNGIKAPEISGHLASDQFVGHDKLRTFHNEHQISILKKTLDIAD